MAEMIVSRGPDELGVGMAIGQYYCCYHGTREQALELLEMALAAVRGSSEMTAASTFPSPPPGYVAVPPGGTGTVETS